MPFLQVEGDAHASGQDLTRRLEEMASRERRLVEVVQSLQARLEYAPAPFLFPIHCFS